MCLRSIQTLLRHAFRFASFALKLCLRFLISAVPAAPRQWIVAELNSVCVKRRVVEGDEN